MSKFATTTYSNKKRIPLVEEGLVALTATVNDAGLVADSEGKKIVVAGTIVGGGFIADPANKVAAANTAGTADLVCAGANNDITLVNKGLVALKVALIDPAANSQTLKLDISTDTIKVLLKTGAGGAIESTGAEVVALLNANPYTSELLVAANKGADTGAAVVTALAAVTIPAPTVIPDGVLLDDVDVTHGPHSGAVAVKGIMDLNKLPAVPSAMAVAALTGRILFAK